MISRGQLAGWRSLLRIPSSRKTLDSFRDVQLQRLVRHAYDQVPYYRQFFDRHGLKPDHVRNVADLCRIPITGKKDLNVLPASAVTASGLEPSRLIVHRTSGSTGEPFCVRRTWLEERLLNGFRRQAHRACGISLRDRIIHLGTEAKTHPRDWQLPHKVLRRLGLCRTSTMACSLPPAVLVERLLAAAPDVLTGSPGELLRIAEHPAARRLRPRRIHTGSEVLMPSQRRRLEAVYGVPILDFYGSHEFNLLAWECPQTGAYHVNDQALILEVIQGDRPALPGERGEVVVTGLYSYAMPFIRYRLGDVVTQGAATCACGMTVGTIHSILGRMLDYFLLPDGTWFHPYNIVTKLNHMAPWIRQYQLVQERRDLVVLRTAAGRPPAQEELAQLHQSIAEMLGSDIVFKVEQVDEIHREPGSKFRPSRSLVYSEYESFDWDRADARSSAA